MIIDERWGQENYENIIKTWCYSVKKVENPPFNVKRKNRSTIRKIVIISKRSNRHHSDQPINVRLTKIQKFLFKKSNFSSHGTLPFLTSTKKTTNWTCGWYVITTLIIFFSDHSKNRKEHLLWYRYVKNSR